MKSILPVCAALVAAVLVGAPAAQAGGNTLSPAASSVFAIGGGAKRTTATAGLFDQKIIDGVQTGIKNFPFMANIAIKTGKTMGQQCGSSILDKDHILTAAHCFKERNPKLYQVRVGSDYWQYKGQVVGISKITIHPKYNASNFDFDVAVARLAKSLRLDSTVKPVSLVPVKTPVKTNTPITLIGWGYTDALHSKNNAVLRSVTVSTISESECSDDYSDYDLVITSRMFCGMGIQKDSCQGDSGGPVIIRSSGKQQGIISWGMGCAQMGAPGVYANVAEPSIHSFITWAQKR